MGKVSRPDNVVLFAPGLLLASFALLAAILGMTGLSVDWTGLGLCIVFSIVVMILGLGLKLAGGSPHIANGALVIAALLGSTVCNTMSVNAGLRLGFPLADSWLLAADAMMGFHPIRAVTFVAAHPRLAEMLNAVYVSSNGIAVMAVIAHGFRRENSFTPLVCYSGGLLAVCCISTMMPAIGNIAYSGLSLDGLPAGAGTYYLPTFHYYREGIGNVVSNDHLSGVAVFPSFHTVMGLVIATSLKGSKLSPLAFVFGIATVISAVPIGGHYVSDVLAGVAVWAFMMGLAQTPFALRRPSAKSRRAAGIGVEGASFQSL